MEQLYTCACPVCAKSEGEDGDIHLSEEELETILRQIYERDFDVETDIQRELYRQTLRLLNEAVDRVFTLVEEENRAFVEELKHNNAVFAAFKTHRQQNDLAEELLDESGTPRSFGDFRKATAPIIGQYNVNWLQTEYLAAIRSARTAERFRRYMQDKDLYPNLRWLPSRAVEPREVHRQYYYQVRSLDDPWWLTHYPGCLWRCQCDMENTKDAITHVGDNPVTLDGTPTGDDAEAVSPGLDRNPAFTGSLFTPTHPYITEAYPGAREAVENFMEGEAFRKRIKEQRAEIRNWAKENLLGRTAAVPGMEGSIAFTSTGIKEALNQPHKALWAKNEAVRDIVELLETGEYIRFDPDIKSNQMVRGYHYVKVEIGGEPSYVVIRELNNGELVFYSIVDKIKKKE